LAVVSIFVGGVSFRVSAPESAIGKQPASAAPMSSSGSSDALFEARRERVLTFERTAPDFIVPCRREDRPPTPLCYTDRHRFVLSE